MREDLTVVRFEADDEHQLRQSLLGDCADICVVAHGRGRLGYQHVAIRSQRAMVGTVKADITHTIRAVESRPTIHVPVSGCASYRIGRRTLRAEPGTVVFLAPGHEYTARVEPGAMRLLQFDADVILQRLPPGHAGRVRTWTLQCVASRSPRNEFAEVFATIDALVGGPEVMASGPGPDFAGAVEHHLAAWLTDFLHDVGGLRVTLPAAVRLAEDSRRWLEQRIAEDVAVARTAHSFGVSARWLQRCFIERWGQTPMDFVASRRLALARARLSDADGTTVVEDVARQSGFGHPGRFAVLYRRTYGESPSQTIAKARYRTRPRQQERQL